MHKDTIIDNSERKQRMEPDYNGLWDTQDVLNFTGWKRAYVSSLCSKGVLPFIPGRPNKFIPSSVKKALEKMQVGAGYGRRKPKKKKTQEMTCSQM